MLIIGAILLLLVTVFVIENRFPITVEFLAWRYNTTLGLALVAAVVVGAVIMYITGTLKQRDLRQQARTAETRVRELERERREKEREQEEREETAAASEGQ